MYLTAIQPTTHALEFASHDLHDTEPINIDKHQPAMADPSRNEDTGQKTTQRPTPSPNKIDHEVDRSTPPFTKRSSMRPIQGPYSPSPLILGGRNMLPNYVNDSKISIPMSAIEADKSSSFSEFNNGPASAAPGRGAKFAGRQGWSFKGNPVVDDTINSGWDVADEMSRLQVSDAQENSALPPKHGLPQDHQHSVPHSGDSASSISPTAQTNEPGDSTLFSYSHSRSPSSATSSDGPASVMTPLHQSKSSMDPKALQDEADRAYSISSMEKPPFGSHQFTSHQDRPSTQHPVPQYPQNVHAHMAVGPAPSMPLESSAEHYDYRNHSLPSHSSANEEHPVDYRYPPEMGVRPMAGAMPMPVTMPQPVPAPAHYAPGIDYRYAPPQGTYPAPPPGAYPPPMPPAAPQPMYGAEMHQHHERGVSAGYPHGHPAHLRPVHHHSASDPAALREAANIILQSYPHLGHAASVYGGYTPSSFYTQADAYTPALAQALARQLQYDAPGYLRDNHGGPSANNRKLGLYKTELCRSWEEKGTCRYGPKCQFAHGEDEIRKVSRHPKYKTEICRTFWVSGSCPYGKRCCFIHTELPISGQALPGATPSPSNADASRPTNQPAPVAPADGRARSLSTNSDPNDQPSSLLARISAKSRESTGGNNAPARPEVTSPTSATTVQAEQAYVPYGRHALGSLRVDTALEGTPSHAVTAFPFSANPAISTTRPSPGPATATGDYANRHFGDLSSGLMPQRLAPMSPMTPVSMQNTHRYSLSGDASIPSLANRSPEARISGGSTPFNVGGTPGDGHITPSSGPSPFHGRSGSGQWVNQARHAPSPSFGSASNNSATANYLHNSSEVAVGPNPRQWS
ncbi:unnamed protein product [Rhizoctonia solani]|uniref:C3H1-type domain-containing protein n=1 Tax=Rhizoctonia solani TaxID=456999 RepID=A0A8H3DH20_9AGAM|nr:unnamed protein product [Rhizoctonia solani]